YRIREAQLKKIPVEIVVGDNEAAEGAVNVRRYGKEGHSTLKIADAIKEFNEEISKSLC
ncbi:MAG: threonine--tRNA ligase, partial [Erysipelotrichaceae bacterium]|nr:threonine--tRNA ligase [Erysipelotrichaceae bacterium]